VARPDPLVRPRDAAALTAPLVRPS
jgi:hypothetical protein